MLIVQDGYLTVEDLDSVNGTLLNGERTRGRQVVRPGDRLGIGPLCFLVQYHLSREAIQRLRQGGGEAAEAAPLEAEAEELDVLPLAEVEAEDADVEALEALPEVEDIPEAAIAEEEELLEPIAVDDEEVQTASEGWHLPESNELRDILEQMEGEKPGRGPKPKRP
jgi:hypothetical protein